MSEATVSHERWDFCFFPPPCLSPLLHHHSSSPGKCQPPLTCHPLWPLWTNLLFSILLEAKTRNTDLQNESREEIEANDNREQPADNEIQLRPSEKQKHRSCSRPNIYFHFQKSWILTSQHSFFLLTTDCGKRREKKTMMCLVRCSSGDVLFHNRCFCSVTQVNLNFTRKGPAGEHHASLLNW